MINILIDILIGIIFTLLLCFTMCYIAHLRMNPNGKFISYNKFLHLLLNYNGKWNKDHLWKNSIFGNDKFCNNNGKYVYDKIHADLIIINGIQYRLYPLGYLKMKLFIKNWDLPYRSYY